jgi:hypothetical protein
MNEVERLITSFEAARSDDAWKLDVLLDLEPLRDVRIVQFLLRVLADTSESIAVRVAVLRALRNRHLTGDERVRLAALLCELTSDTPANTLDLRSQSALALAEFTNVDRVVVHLGELAADDAATFDVRYAAFTSLQEAGPTPESIAWLRRLSDDDTLGRSARRILVVWRV